jgi:hypothetical protein
VAYANFFIMASMDVDYVRCLCSFLKNDEA